MAAQGRLQFSEETTTTPLLTGAFVAIVTLDCRDYNSMSLLLKNTGATHSLKYKMQSRSHFASGQLYDEVASATLAPAGLFQQTFTKKLATLIVSLKTSTTSITTYQLDHIRGI